LPILIILGLCLADILSHDKTGELPCWILPNATVNSSFNWGRDCPFLAGDKLEVLSWSEGREKGNARSLEAIQTILARAPPRLSVSVRRGAESVEKEVDIHWRTRPEKLRRYAIAGLVAILLFFTQAILLLRTQSKAPAALLALQSCVLSVFIVGAVGQSGALPQVAAVSVLCLVPAALLHLGLVFPNLRPLVRSHPGVLFLPYLVLALVALFGAWSVAENPFFWRLLAPLLGALLLGSWIWLILSCWFAVRESPVGVARAQARLLLLGAVGSCLVFFVVAYHFEAPQPILFALSGAPLLLPIPVGLAISQYDLFSLPFKTRRSVASGLVAATYAMAAAGAAWVVIGSFSGRYLAELILLLFGLFALIEKGRRGMSYSLDWLLMRRAAGLRLEVDRLTLEVADIQDQREVCQRFVESVSNTLGGNACAVHLRVGERLVCSAAIGEGCVVRGEAIGAASGMLRADGSVLHLGNLGESILLAERKLLDIGVEVVVPIRHGHMDLGVVLMGGSPDGISYSYEETQFLREASIPLASAIHRSGLVDGLIQAERRATTGRVGLAIAHEIGKQLGSIELLAGNISELGQVSATEEIKRVAQDGQKTLTEFIREAKSTEGRMSDQATFFEIVDDTKRIACSGGCRVPVVIRIDPSLGQVRAPRILVHALVGILDNAIAATVAASSSENAVSIAVIRKERGAVIVVEDRGVGIEASFLSRIRTLGFSTKSEGGGHGVGLTVASEILKGIGATLEIRSVRGIGTTMTVALPEGSAGSGRAAC